MKTRSVSASVSVLGSRIGINQYIVDQEGYQRVPSFVSAKEIGFIAPVNQQDVVEDELEVRVGRLIMIYPVSGLFLRWGIFCIPSGPRLQCCHTSFPSGRRITLTGARAHTRAPVALRFEGIALLHVRYKGLMGHFAVMKWRTVV